MSMSGSTAVAGEQKHSGRTTRLSPTKRSLLDRWRTYSRGTRTVDSPGVQRTRSSGPGEGEHLPGRILGLLSRWVLAFSQWNSLGISFFMFWRFKYPSIYVKLYCYMSSQWLKNGMVLDPTKWRNLLFMGSTASTWIYLCFLCHVLCVAGSFYSILLVRVI
jgi:hypothetical protein